MGRRLEDIRRLRERMAVGQLSPEEARLERLQIKDRIIGTLLKDARASSARTPAECARLLGIGEDQYASFEAGDRSPTLPQLEVLAYFFNVPLNHFWSGETLATRRQEADVEKRIPEMMTLRTRIIGVQVMKVREDKELTIEAVADNTGIDASRIRAVEAGEIDIPVTELELLMYGAKSGLDSVSESHGAVGTWLQAQEDYEAFSSLPADLRAFILKPINRSYLELAVRLSQMEVGKLRTIAESILDITL
nr:transcriptional regulator [Anaerolineae bacterium]